MCFQKSPNRWQHHCYSVSNAGVGGSVGVCVGADDSNILHWLTGIPSRCCLPSHVWHWRHRQHTSVKTQKSPNVLSAAPKPPDRYSYTRRSRRPDTVHGSQPTHSPHTHSLPNIPIKKTHPLPLPRSQQLIKQADFVLQTNYSIRLSDKAHITDKCVHKSDSQLPHVTRQPISYFEGRFYISVGVICLIFLLEPVSLQTSRSATAHVQTNCTLCSLGQDSLSLPQSNYYLQLLSLSFFLKHFSLGNTFFGFLRCSPPHRAKAACTMGPASYLWGFLWGSALFLEPFSSSAQAFIQVISQEDLIGKNQSMALL